MQPDEMSAAVCSEMCAHLMWAVCAVQPLQMHDCDKKDLSIKAVQRTVLCMGRKQDAVENVPCGNTVALVRACTYFLLVPVVNVGGSPTCIQGPAPLFCLALGSR
eukprot:1145159-Pelagomonas_calceolata.AAC.8